MQVSNLILQVRSRLHDEQCEKWNDTEILDCLNLSYINLARVLRLFIQEKLYCVSKESLTQELPQNFLDIQSVYKNKRQVPIIRLYESNSSLEAVSIDNAHIHFQGSGDYTMRYYCFYILVGKEDTLLLPAIANNALLFYALFLLLQKKPHQNALQEVGFYKALYAEELQNLQRDVYRSHESKMLVANPIVV